MGESELYLLLQQTADFSVVDRENIPTMERSDCSAAPHVVNMDVVGSLTVFVQGELDKLRDGVVFMTVHTVAASFNSWLEFAGDANMEDIRKKSLFLHLVLPGQEPGAEDLPSHYTFPSMDEIGLNLVTVLDSLRVRQVIGLGDGAGANILLRFAMNHPSRVLGIVAINTEGIESATIQERLERIKGNRGEELNKKNVAKFIDAYKKRTEILSQLNAKMKIDVLMIAGMKSKCVDNTEKMHQEITPGLSSLIKVEDVRDPLLEAPDKVAEALVLFCQGLGLLPSIKRRGSLCSQGSEGTRKMSMTMCDFDVPNIRRLSLTARDGNGAGETGET